MTTETATDVAALHRRAVAAFGDRVLTVRDDQWAAPTPCTGWDVRALVNHVVAEELWTPPLLAGATIGEVGDRFDGDVLGADPRAAWRSASEAAVSAVDAPEALERTVHLSFGDTPAQEYARQLFADHLVHAWDLARATGGDESLPDDLVEACARWWDGAEEDYRGAGVVAARADVPADADAQTTLLARFGRRRGAVADGGTARATDDAIETGG